MAWAAKVGRLAVFAAAEVTADRQGRTRRANHVHDSPQEDGHDKINEERAGYPLALGKPNASIGDAKVGRRC